MPRNDEGLLEVHVANEIVTRADPAAHVVDLLAGGSSSGGRRVVRHDCPNESLKSHGTQWKRASGAPGRGSR